MRTFPCPMCKRPVGEGASLPRYTRAAGASVVGIGTETLHVGLIISLHLKEFDRYANLEEAWIMRDAVSLLPHTFIKAPLAAPAPPTAPPR